MTSRRRIGFGQGLIHQTECIHDSFHSPVTLNLYLAVTDVDGKEWLQVESSKEEDRDILKQLRKTFGFKVKISVCVKPTAHPQRSEREERLFIFQEGMKIREGNGDSDYCKGIAVRVNEFNLRETRFDIVIIADISDDDELIRESKEEFCVPMTITRKILEEGLGSDVVIIAGNGTEIKSHRSFLIASSPVFERMFANELEESKTGRVEMTDVSEKGARALLGYIYCGDNIDTKSDLDLAFELLYASHKYEVSKLEDFMIPHWMSINDDKIRVKFAFKMYMFLRDIETLSGLKAKMLRILHRNYDALKTLPEYDELHKTPKDAKDLCEDFVKMSEPRM